jgi:hypothetical protein
MKKYIFRGDKLTLFPYENEIDPDDRNINTTKLKKVIGLFKKQQLSEAFPSGQLVVSRYWKAVVHVSCSIARGCFCFSML